MPRWSGEILDLVVDFTTYVFVPAYAIVAGGVLPAWSAAVAGVCIVVSGALYFADRAMKTDDNYFRGFPALWNIAAFYLLLIRPPPLLALAFVAALVAATFVPFPFIHPVRVRRHRAFNIALLALWGGIVMGIYTIGLTMIGELFKGGELVGANALYVTLYALGMLMGPASEGVALDAWNPHGLVAALGSICGVYLL